MGEEVHVRVIPIEQMGSAGVCHVKIPLELQAPFMPGGVGPRWLEKVAERDSLQHDSPFADELDELVWVAMYAVHAFVLNEIHAPCLLHVDPWVPSVAKLETEENNWHYDMWDELDVGYDKQESRTEADFTPEGRVLITLPFPIGWQRPTVVVPWRGEFAGLKIQAPVGYATGFFLKKVWHRGDRNPFAPRGLMATGFGTVGLR
jgi:hypothetical protein